jgi:hypothetical protein
MMRPDGKMTDEVKLLTQKVQEWCDGVGTRRLTPEEVWYSVNSTILKTLEYPLVATTLTQTQFTGLLQSILKVILPMCRVQWKLPRALVFGSLRSRGLTNLYWTQLIHHLQSILQQIHRNTLSKDLHTENMDALQFHIGLSVTFWELPFEEYGPLAPEGWMKHTWEGLSHTTLMLKGPNLSLPDEREGDVALMDAFVAQGYDRAMLTCLNDCRLFLGASHLSHLSTACGARIDNRCWQGKHHLSDLRPKLIQTHRPSTDAWVMWRKALSESFLTPHETHLRLRTPLGPWKKTTSPTWKWWKHPSSPYIYKKMENGQWKK